MEWSGDLPKPKCGAPATNALLRAIHVLQTGTAAWLAQCKRLEAAVAGSRRSGRCDALCGASPGQIWQLGRLVGCGKQRFHYAQDFLRARDHCLVRPCTCCMMNGVVAMPTAQTDCAAILSTEV